MTGRAWVVVIAVALAAGSVVLTIAYADVHHPEISVIYGEGDDAQVFGGRFDDFRLSDGYLWLGATAAFALIALGAAARVPAWSLGPAVAACTVVAVLNRDQSLDELGFEGAYFSRGEVDHSLFAHFDLWDGVMWAGAGAALALAGLLLVTVRPLRAPART